ncbi:MAG: ferritin-like domain-containing protein [Planctomycetes bacterium]|nr:ferritin-like domain-containing protein [Planctomycetota bacterium]
MESLKAGTKSLDNMEDLFIEKLKMLYDVEDRLVDALPKMADAAADAQLKRAFDEHAEVSRRQKERLAWCFDWLNVEAETSTCEAIKGMISDGEVIMKADGDPDVKDAALIAAAQGVEHYEIAEYGAARTFASRLGLDDIADLLQQTLDEEAQTDHKLTDLAASRVNPSAQV